MDVTLIPDVFIGTEGAIRKFIVAKVHSSDVQKLVIRADGKSQYHADILDALNKEVASQGCCAECVGGGFLNVRSRLRCIFISGKSSRYGAEPDRQKTADMLRKHFPEYCVEVLD